MPIDFLNNSSVNQTHSIDDGGTIDAPLSGMGFRKFLPIKLVLPERVSVS